MNNEVNTPYRMQAQRSLRDTANGVYPPLAGVPERRGWIRGLAILLLVCLTVAILPLASCSDKDATTAEPSFKYVVDDAIPATLTAPIQCILNSGIFFDARHLAPPPQVTTGTYHNWGYTPEIIDYIFVSGDWTVHEFQVGPSKWENTAGQNIWVSDHSPIQTKISL